MGRAVEAGPIFVFAYGVGTPLLIFFAAVWASLADCHECDMQGRGEG